MACSRSPRALQRGEAPAGRAAAGQPPALQTRPAPPGPAGPLAALSSHRDPPGARAAARSTRPGPTEPRGCAAGSGSGARAQGGWGPGPKGAETPQAWGSGRHEAGLARPPGPRRRRGRLRPLESPRPPVGRHSLGHGGDGGPGDSEEWRREQDARRGRPRLRPAAAGLPGPRPRPAGAGQSEARGGAVQTRHWSSRAPVTPPEAGGPAPCRGADSGERRAHR